MWGRGVTDQAGRHGPDGGQVVTFGTNYIKPRQPSEECGVCEVQTDANGGMTVVVEVRGSVCPSAVVRARHS